MSFFFSVEVGVWLFLFSEGGGGIGGVCSISSFISFFLRGWRFFPPLRVHGQWGLGG